MKLLAVAAMLGFAMPAMAQEAPKCCSKTVEAKVKQECQKSCDAAEAALAKTQDCQKSCPEAALAKAEDCQKSCQKAALAALTEECEGCPLAAAEELVKSFNAAKMKMASISDADKAAMASLDMEGVECPIGKRMGPTMEFIGNAVSMNNDFQAYMLASEEMAQVPEDMKSLMDMRGKMLAAMGDVLAAQASVGSACGASEECDVEIIEEVTEAVEASKTECPSTKATLAKTAGECSASQECPTTAAALAKKAGDGQECPAAAAALAKKDGECSAKSECSATLASKGEFCPQTFEKNALAMIEQGDKLLACWGEAPKELASMCCESKAKLKQAVAVMASVDPSMEPSLRAINYYASTLAKINGVNAKLTAMTAEAGCEGCPTFKASCDVLTRAQALADAMKSNLQASMAEETKTAAADV